MITYVDLAYLICVMLIGGMMGVAVSFFDTKLGVGIFCMVSLALILMKPAHAGPYQPLDHAVGIALERVPEGSRVYVYNYGSRWYDVVVTHTDGPCKTYTHGLFPGFWQACRSNDGQWSLKDGPVTYARIRVRLSHENKRCMDVGVTTDTQRLDPLQACHEGARSYTIRYR